MKNVITKDINIAEMLDKYPQTREVLMNMGLGCVGCVASSFETLEEGLNAHELDVDETITKLNSVIEKKE